MQSSLKARSTSRASVALFFLLLRPFFLFWLPFQASPASYRFVAGFSRTSRELQSALV